jgi:hypothetical protein
MFVCNILTTHRFVASKGAGALLRFLLKEGGPFTPTRFGKVEAAKTPLNSDDLEEAIDLLSGTPAHRWGAIFLKGAKSKVLIWLHWSDQLKLQIWRVYIDETYLKKPESREEYLAFLQRLFMEYPPFFAGAAPIGEFEEKRFVEDVGDFVNPQDEPRFCLPGIYWLTVFGSELSQVIGKEKPLRAPAEKIIELKSGGIALLASSDPFDPALQEHETAVLQAIGQEYFVDKKEPEKRCGRIVDLIKTLPAGA